MFYKFSIKNIKLRTIFIIDVILLIALFFALRNSHAQELSINKKQTALKVNEKLIVNENTEVEKLDKKGNFRAKVYSAPKFHFDKMSGEYIPVKLSEKREIAGADTFSYGNFYVIYEPLFSLKNIVIYNQKSIIRTKEDIVLKNSNAPTILTWRIRTNADIEFNNGELIYTFNKGEFLFKTLRPNAIDNKNNDIPVEVSLDKDILTYKLDVTEIRSYPVIIDPTTTAQAENDGTLRRTSAADWATARDNTTSNDKRTDQLQIEADYTGSAYNCGRGFLSFPIPAVTSCAAGTLYVRGNYDHGVDMEIYLLTSTYDISLPSSAYNDFDGWTSGSAHTGTVLNATWTDANFVTGWNTFIFNTDGKNAVVAASEDTLKIVMISKKDYDRTTPTERGMLIFDSSEDSGTEPYLSIVYNLGGIDNRQKIYNLTTQYLYKLTRVPLWQPD